MRGSFSSRTAATLAALAAVALIALTLSGCAWLGKGKDVADAYANTKAAKTGAYSLTLSVKAPRRRQAKPVNETVTAQGAYDQTDPNNVKFRLTEGVANDSIAIVAPGNGRVYVTIGGQTASEKIPKTVAPTAKQQALSGRFSDALAGAFVNFRDAPPVVRSDGTQIQGIAADISRNKVCGCH